MFPRGYFPPGYFAPGYFFTVAAAAGLSAGFLSSPVPSQTAIAFSDTPASGGTAPYSYQTKVSSNGGTSYVNSGAASSSPPTTTASNLTPGTSYLVKVTVTDALAASVDSNVLTVTTAATITPPIAPTLAAITAAANPTLNWGAVTGATSYSVYRNGGLPLQTGITGTTFTDTTAAAGTTYSYTVSATGAGGEGAQSSAQSVTTTAATPPLAPTNLALAFVGLTAQLAWTAPSGGADSYNVYYRLAGGTTYSGPLSASGTTGFVGGLAASTAYDFLVKAVRVSGGESVAGVGITNQTTPSISAAVAAVVATLQAEGIIRPSIDTTTVIENLQRRHRIPTWVDATTLQQYLLDTHQIPLY